MPRLLLTAIAAAAALAASGPALADDSYELSIGYQLDTSRSGDIGDMRHLESNAIDKYELCAQGVHVGQDQADCGDARSPFGRRSHQFRTRCFK
jgi:hypothetical protein